MNAAKLEEIRAKHLAGEIKSRVLERMIFEEVYDGDKDFLREACNDAARIRCEGIEASTGSSMEQIKNARVDNCGMTPDGSILTGIESKIGGAIVPMGIAGPIRIHGEYVHDEEIWMPLATNEAALVAGVQRGAKALNLAGGIYTMVRYDGMSRAPLIEAPNIYEGRKLVRRVSEDKAFIEELGKYARDPFVRLESIDGYQLGTKIFLRMNMKTGDAMGMNGVTKASADITRALLAMPEYADWKLITISSNMCTDKKANHLNILNGRGKSVEAECFIPNEVLAKVFKAGVNARSVEKTVFHKCYLGSALSGSVTGFNVNAANPLAALFCATGQDLAHVVNSASCYVQADAYDNGLHYMVTMPCMELATIGGGTMFGTAREALKMIGCGGFGKSVDDNDNVMRLAEIACATVACLEINTASAQAAGYEMADSHVKLARGEKE